MKEGRKEGGRGYLRLGAGLGGLLMLLEILTVVGVALDGEVAVEVQAVDVPEVTCNTTQC